MDNYMYMNLLLSLHFCFPFIFLSFSCIQFMFLPFPFIFLHVRGVSHTVFRSCPCFFRMRSKGSRFTLGVWGLSCVRRTLRLYSQPSATVRNRSREGRMGVPMVSSAKGITFGGFQRRVASCRVAGVALCDIPACFKTCQKSSCVAGTILLPLSFCVAGARL